LNDVLMVISSNLKIMIENMIFKKITITQRKIKDHKKKSE